MSRAPEAPGPVLGCPATEEQLQQLFRARAWAAYRPQDLSVFEQDTLRDLDRRLRDGPKPFRVTGAEMQVIGDLLAGTDPRELDGVILAGVL